MTQRLVHVTSGGSEVFYDQGTFDSWCVYVQRKGEKRYAPKDTEYFSFLLDYSAQSGNPKAVYVAFCKIYKIAAKQISPHAGELIREVASDFGDRAEEAELHLAVMYAAMIAEENKAFTRLGKKVKRLGVYQVLKGILSPAEAANWSRGKPWRVIAGECEKIGF